MFPRSRNPLMAFLLSYQVRVTLKIQVNFGLRRYWWFCLINFWNFSTIHVFEVKESIADIPTELPGSCDLKNPGQLPVKEVLMICLINFWNFSTIYVFEVKESIADIPTELPYLGDLENPGQLPVQEVLMIISYGFSQFLLHYYYYYYLLSLQIFACSLEKSQSTAVVTPA